MDVLGTGLMMAFEAVGGRGRGLPRRPLDEDPEGGGGGTGGRVEA